MSDNESTDERIPRAGDLIHCGVTMEDEGAPADRRLIGIWEEMVRRARVEIEKGKVHFYRGENDDGRGVYWSIISPETKMN
jgi:hypothetical protein